MRKNVNFARIAASLGVGFYLGTLHGYFFSVRLLAKFEFPARTSNKTCLKNLEPEIFCYENLLQPEYRIGLLIYELHQMINLRIKSSEISYQKCWSSRHTISHNVKKTAKCPKKMPDFCFGVISKRLYLHDLLLYFLNPHT